MIGKFWDELFKIGDKYAERFGKKSIVVEVVHEIEDALHDVYEESEARKERITDRPPQNVEEILAFKHERVTPYVDPDDGQLMYEVTLDHSGYTKRCDTAYEVVDKILTAWDRGWRAADAMQRRMETSEERLNAVHRKLTRARQEIARLREENKYMLIEKSMEAALKAYLAGDANDVLVYYEDNLQMERLSNILKGAKFLVEQEKPDESPEKAKKKAPEAPKKKMKEEDENPSYSPEADEEIKRQLKVVGSAVPAVQPLSPSEAEVAIRLNGGMPQEQIAAELKMTHGNVSRIISKLKRYFGEEVIKKADIPLVRRKDA